MATAVCSGNHLWGWPTPVTGISRPQEASARPEEQTSPSTVPACP